MEQSYAVWLAAGLSESAKDGYLAGAVYRAGHSRPEEEEDKRYHTGRRGRRSWLEILEAVRAVETVGRSYKETRQRIVRRSVVVMTFKLRERWGEPLMVAAVGAGRGKRCELGDEVRGWRLEVGGGRWEVGGESDEKWERQEG